MSMHPLRLDHIGLKVTDLAAAKRFYAAALEPLGMSRRQMECFAIGVKRGGVLEGDERCLGLFTDQSG